MRAQDVAQYATSSQTSYISSCATSQSIASPDIFTSAVHFSTVSENLRCAGHEYDIRMNTRQNIMFTQVNSKNKRPRPAAKRASVRIDHDMSALEEPCRLLGRAAAHLEPDGTGRKRCSAAGASSCDWRVGRKTHRHCRECLARGTADREAGSLSRPRYQPGVNATPRRWSCSSRPVCRPSEIIVSRRLEGAHGFGGRSSAQGKWDGAHVYMAFWTRPRMTLSRTSSSRYRSFGSPDEGKRASQSLMSIMYGCPKVRLILSTR